MSDPAVDRVTRALGDCAAGMVVGWVLIGTYHDEDGALRTALLANDGARTHETLGLLSLGETVWKEEARRWVMGNNET